MPKLLLFVALLVAGVLVSSVRVAVGNSNDDDEFVEVMPKSTHVEDDDDEYVDIVPEVVEEEEDTEPVPRTSAPPTEDDDSDELVEKASDTEAEADSEPASATTVAPKGTFSDSVDEEEFEGFEEIAKPAAGAEEEAVPVEEVTKKPSLSETPVPRHVLRTMRMNWDQYFVELVMLLAVVAYGANFLVGKSKNSTIAYTWFEAHQEVLAANFAVVGDDGEGDSSSQNVVIRDAENVFLVHCSGRANCESLLVELQLLKRQDLMQQLTQFIRPKSDSVTITVNLSAEDMDPFVFAVAPKRNIARLMKEQKDLGYLSPEKRRCDQYGLPASYSVVSETTEVLPNLLNTAFVATLKKYEELIEFIHFSDQYVPNLDQDDSAKDDKAAQSAVAEALKSAQRVLIFKLSLPPKMRFTTLKQMEKLVPVMKMVMSMIDRVKRCHLSREARERAIKNRAKMSEEVSKLTHQQRQEQAQERREERLRKEKERYMSEEDPEKARKLQDKALQREQKKKNPKMKTAILRRG